MTIEMESVTCDTRSLVSSVSSSRLRAREAKVKQAKEELKRIIIAEQKALELKRLELEFEARRIELKYTYKRAKLEESFRQELQTEV